MVNDFGVLRTGIKHGRLIAVQPLATKGPYGYGVPLANAFPAVMLHYG